MRILILGAAGDMGRTAARHIASIEGVDDVVLADLDEAAAGRLAASIEGSTASLTAARIDILERDALRRLLDPADLVVNCAGPFFRLGPPALRAAIDVGTHYLDICDDPQPTTEMLAMADDARRAGVAAVVGMGASPGLSNLLAQRAARRLDAVTDCFTAWPLDVSTGEPSADGPEGHDDAPPAAVIHLMEQIHGTVAVAEGGRLVQRPPLEVVELEYPGHGAGAGYVVGHPEPLTLLGSLGISGRCANLVLLSSGATAAFLRGLRADLDAAALDLQGAARELLAPAEGRLQRAAAEAGDLPGPGGLPPFFALVHGTRSGRPVSVGCHLTAFPRGMAGITSIPAALAVAQMIVHLPPPGVHAPEAVIDGDRLLAGLLPFCRPQVDSVEALAPVLTSETGRVREGPP